LKKKQEKKKPGGKPGMLTWQDPIKNPVVTG
jgi:hypothetical protein